MIILAGILNILTPLVTLVLVVCAILLILVVLMQRPKNEGLGAAFGGGMTDQMFGAQTTSVLQKATVWLGIIFIGSTLLLAILQTKKNTNKEIATTPTTEETALTPAEQLEKAEQELAATAAKGIAADDLSAQLEAAQEATISEVKDAAAGILDTAKNAGNAATEGVKDAADAVKETATKAVETAKDAGAAATEGAKEAASKAVDTAKDAGAAATEGAKAATNAVKETAAKAVDTAKDAGTATTEGVKEAAGATKDTATKAVDAIKGAITE